MLWYVVLLLESVSIIAVRFSVYVNLSSPILELYLRVRTTTGKPELKYTCAWAPFCESREPVEWVTLSKSAVTPPNMLLHKLEEGSSAFLKSIVGHTPSTKALLLINQDNTFEVDTKFLAKVGYPSMPVLVVTKEVGVALSKLVEETITNIMVSDRETDPLTTEGINQVAESQSAGKE